MSGAQRFPIPGIFRPTLSLIDALIAVVAGLCRIFFGCLLFGVWGAGIVATWDVIQSHVWRAVAVFVLTIIFVSSLAALMCAISVVAKRLSRN
jgi:hypothetical protein